MKKLNKIGLIISLALFAAVGLCAQQTPSQTDERIMVFHFLSGNDMFYIPWVNGAEFESLTQLVDEYRAEIASRRLPIQVDGYCASLPTVKENLMTAFVRANRIKSELILQKGLKEADFVTGNYTYAYRGNKDVVVVTLRISAKDKRKPAEPVKEQPRQKEPTPADTVTSAIATDSADATPPAVIPGPTRDLPEQEAGSSSREIAGQARNDIESADNNNNSAPYLFALRTNLLYDAFLLPTLGVEWRVNERMGIKIDGSLSRWGGSTGKVQKVWLLNPEVRWYLLRDKRFYVGASGSYGEYNIYKYMLGNMIKDDTGYQGKLWNAGLTVGYQLYLSHGLSVDFNLGLGYTRSEYDSFTMTDGMRVIRQRDKQKSLWGPIQAGISLMWTIGGKK